MSKEWLKEILGDTYTDGLADTLEAGILERYTAIPPASEPPAAEPAGKPSEPTPPATPAAEPPAASNEPPAVSTPTPEPAAAPTEPPATNPEPPATEPVDWQKKYEELQAQTTRESFDRMWQEAVTSGKGLSAKSIAAEVGAEKMTELQAITDPKAQAEAMHAAVEELKSSHPFLYGVDTPPVFPAGTGSGKVNEPTETINESITKRLFGDK